MAPPAPQQQQSQGDNSLSALWLTLFFFALIGVIWYVFHGQIVWFVFKLKYFEAVMASLFSGHAIPIAQALKNYNTTGIAVSTFIAVVQGVGKFMRYPVIIILFTLAAVLFYTHPGLRFKKIHNMKTLYEQEKFNWPQIMPVSKMDMVKQPIEKGPWAMSLTPMQFAKKFRLIVEERQKISGLGTQRENVSISLARAEAYQIFAAQLGSYWLGVDKLNVHTRALFAIFALCAHHEQDKARRLLNQVAISSASGELNFTGVDEIVRKYQDTLPVKRLLENHAYVMTFMASMLILARQDGVLASADFLWLKVVDRPLWYMLNSVGRQTAFIEISGPFAHWMAERKLGRKISVPMVEEAVKALDIALKEVIYVPEEGQ
jgi:intracellular multiplication protein IcmP